MRLFLLQLALASLPFTAGCTLILGDRPPRDMAAAVDLAGAVDLAAADLAGGELLDLSAADLSLTLESLPLAPTSCPVGAFMDDFSANDLAATGLWNGSFGLAGEAAGLAYAKPAANVAMSYSEVRTTDGTTYDLTASCVFVEVTQVTNQMSPAFTFVQIETATSGATWFVQNGILSARLNDNGAHSILKSLPYDGTILWWRLRGEVPDLYFDLSRDGQTWRVVAKTQVGWANAVRISLAGGTDVTTPSPGEADFDNFNLHP